MTWRRGTRGMVSIGLALAFLAGTAGAWSQASLQDDRLFAGWEKFAKGASDTTEVNLDKNMLSMAGKSLGISTDQTEAALAKRLDFIYIRDYKYAKPGQYNMAEVRKYIDRLDGGGWEHMIRERSATESTDICFRGGDDGEASELVIIAAEPTDLTFVHMKGQVSIDELSKLGEKYGAPKLKARPQ